MEGMGEQEGTTLSGRERKRLTTVFHELLVLLSVANME
jgi:hypothetical protein